MVGGRHFESQTPHFFKIILSDALQNGRLGIPKKFVRKYGSNLSDLVFLQVPSGQAWEVELVRRTDGVWLRRGWPDFVKHYAIKHGHFLVFRYEGGSAFRVVIFDKSASEIKYPIITELPKREENEGDTGGEKSEALKRAASFQSSNPFFLTLMQPSLICHSLRFWLARYKFGIYGRKTQVKINSGWKLFVQDNNLKVGDICIFELLDSDLIVLKVSIFRYSID
ncbi:hypothetical protein EUGRSUZ_L02216 [Eucalyptus grandis]|uniref:TF-B3 domain-containing protein n=1 Tax=Eucalyptus grandis TaxID=71139 RepID=A0A058ZRB6_EUCGR|nr:hypothetical protein EUGRSUZ_L02216 [Eucalyptus grandis]